MVYHLLLVQNIWGKIHNLCIENVPTNFISKLKSMDATVSIVGNSYDESLEIAMTIQKNGWILISDSIVKIMMLVWMLRRVI